MAEILHYRKNKKLRGENVEIPYTDEQYMEIIKCTNDPVYFIENFIRIRALGESDYVSFKLRGYQKSMVDMLHNDNRIIIKTPRQSGKTVTTIAYIVWYIIFNPLKEVSIVANKESTARKILKKIQKMFEILPMWLQVGVCEWNKGSVTFDNDSKIYTSSTSTSGNRGDSIDLLYMDEFAFIPKETFNEFFESVYPTIMSSPKTKLIMSSTPKGMNHFYKFWEEAVNGKSGFSFLDVHWTEVPRGMSNEEFKKKTIAEFGENKWFQEFEAQFMGAEDSILKSDVLENQPLLEPVREEFDGKLRYYMLPEEDKSYIIIADVGEGVGADDTTFHVFNIDTKPYRQCCVYNDNQISPMYYHTILDHMSKIYNNAFVLVENNSIGREVLDNLFTESENENLIYEAGKDFGIKTTAKSKTKGCSDMRHMFEMGHIIVHDFRTIQQLSNFTRNSNGSYSGKDDHDDLVMPIVLLSYFLNNKELTQMWLDSDDVQRDMYKEKQKELDDHFLDFMFSDDGMNHSPDW